MIGWLRFTINFLLYFILFWALACILLSADKACAQEATLVWPDAHSSFEAYLASGEHHRVMHRLGQQYVNCLLESMAGSAVPCGKSPWETHRVTPAPLVMPPVKVVAEANCNALVLGEFTGLVVDRVLSCLPEKGDFSIVVDGPGSRVDDLLHLLKGVSEWRAKGHRLTCVVQKEADSGNAYFFESPECDTREIYTNGRLGIHHMVLYMIHGGMSLVELQQLVKDGLVVENMLYGLVASRIVGGPSEAMVAVLRRMVEEQPGGLLMFTSWQAIGINLADRVVRP